MNKRVAKFSVWGLVITFTLGLSWYFFMTDALVVFDLLERKIISRKCDADGLRQVQMYIVEGNAVTNPSIHVSVHFDCDNYERKDERIVFTADNGSITADDVKFDLVAVDTLRIEYKRGFRIFTKLDKVVFMDSTLNLNVIYREVE